MGDLLPATAAQVDYLAALAAERGMGADDLLGNNHEAATLDKREASALIDNLLAERWCVPAAEKQLASGFHEMPLVAKG